MVGWGLWGRGVLQTESSRSGHRFNDSEKVVDSGAGLGGRVRMGWGLGSEWSVSHGISKKWTSIQ